MAGKSWARDCNSEWRLRNNLCNAKQEKNGARGSPCANPSYWIRWSKVPSDFKYQTLFPDINDQRKTVSPENKSPIPHVPQFVK